jgi:hypothetical protein
VKIVAGELMEIDNGSGHYKPTQQNLIECLKVLKVAGLKLTNTQVCWWVGPGPTDMCPLVAAATLNLY